MFKKTKCREYNQNLVLNVNVKLVRLWRMSWKDSEGQ